VTIPAEFRRTDIPRALRPRCAAKTRSGAPCQGQALVDGFCFRHSALVPAEAVGEEGKKRQGDNGRAVLQLLWRTRWKEGKPPSKKARWKISGRRCANMITIEQELTAVGNMLGAIRLRLGQGGNMLALGRFAA
jgi:hypothetical protein